MGSSSWYSDECIYEEIDKEIEKLIDINGLIDLYIERWIDRPDERWTSSLTLD